MTTVTFWLTGASEPKPVVIIVRVLPRIVEVGPKEAETLGKYRVDAKSNADRGTLIIKTYSVADLVVPLPAQRDAAGKPKPLGASDWLKLIDRIFESVEPQGWEENGGPCTIKTHESTLSLVIWAPQSTHEKIAKLLDQQRREQDVQIVFETQFLQTVGELPAGLKFEVDDKSRWA